MAQFSYAAQDFDQAKASCLWYRVGDSLYDLIDRTPAASLPEGTEARYDGVNTVNDAIFAGHGLRPYGVYTGKNTLWVSGTPTEFGDGSSD